MEMSTEAAILRTENLSHAVDGTHLVDHISVEIQAGDVAALVGPSGAGKSSFLRLLNRLDEPTEGTVFLKGVDYREIPPQDLRRQVGMVMQSPYLFRGTVSDNLRFGPLQRGEELSREAMEKLLARVNLSGYANRDVGNLSGGEAQRVSLARTLANAPGILLLDEPTSSLDDNTQRDVERLICEIIRDGELTALIVTHDKDQARRMARRVMVLESGRLVDFGLTKEVLGA
jgi:putative ABC transport system ATP-binding protein